MPKLPLVSVVMPVFNGEPYLKAAVESILNQTYKNIEFIILDDGSTDHSLDILRNYESTHDHIILIHNKENQGIIRTLNTGIRQSKGKYIARMDADDISFPERITKQVAFLEQHPKYAIIGCKTELIFNHRKPSGIRPLLFDSYEELKISSFFYSPFSHPTVMMRKELIESDPYHENYPKVEDFELWNNVLLKHPCANLNEVLLYYRMHPFQETQTQKEIQLNALNKVFKKKFNEFNIPFKEEKLHLLIPGSNPKELNPNELKKIDQYLSELNIDLSQQKITDKKIIQKIFRKVWEQVCKKGKRYGLQTHHVYKHGKFYDSNKNNFLYYFFNSSIFRPFHFLYKKIKHA